MSVWLDKEGGGQQAIAGLNFFINKIINDNVVDRMVEINAWTGRLELALPRKEILKESGDRWSIDDTRTANDSADKGSSGSASADTRLRTSSGKDSCADSRLRTSSGKDSGDAKKNPKRQKADEDAASDKQSTTESSKSKKGKKNNLHLRQQRHGNNFRL